MKIPAMHPLRLLAGLAVCGVAISAFAFAAGTPAPSHRYLIQRTFPLGALDGLDADTKAMVNRTNARFGVKWLMSFANGDKTRTFCIYEGPSENAIREAAAANHLPVDSVTEVPVTLEAR